MAKGRERDRDDDDDRSEKRGFRYERRSREDVKARANMRGGGFDSFIKQEFKRYKVRDGKNLVRILPATWEKAKHYGYDIWINYGIGADNQSYLSLSKMDHEDADRDPLVEARREAQREGDEKVAKALAPRQRVLVWVIDRNEEDEGPQLWDIPFSVDKDFVNLCLDEDTKGVSYPDDPKKGHDIRFYKEGSGVGTKYPAARMKILDESPLHEDRDIYDEWMGYVEENPVPECLQFYSADEIQAAFDGHVATRDDDDEDKPKKRSRDDDDDDRPAKRRARDDDEDEKPRRSRSRDDDDDDKPKRRERVREDADDDDDKPRSSRKRPADDDDEPEEKPKRRERVREDDDDADEKPRTKRAREDDAENDDDAEEKPRQSIRERLAARKKSAKPADDDD
jgi:hypothetical protein